VAAVANVGGGDEGWWWWGREEECQTNNCLFGNDSLFGNGHVPNKQPDSSIIPFCQSGDHSGLNSGLTKFRRTENAPE
jgi:hypothetical protein